MATWADPSATWAASTVTWTGVGPVEPPRRTNFLLLGWYFARQEPWQDVIDFAEGRTDDLFV